MRFVLHQQNDAQKLEWEDSVHVSIFLARSGCSRIWFWPALEQTLGLKELRVEGWKAVKQERFSAQTVKQLIVNAAFMLVREHLC